MSTNTINNLTAQEHEQLVGGSSYTVRSNPNLSEDAIGIIKEYTNTTTSDDDSSMVDMTDIHTHYLDEKGFMYNELEESDIHILELIKEDFIEFSERF